MRKMLAVFVLGLVVFGGSMVTGYWYATRQIVPRTDEVLTAEYLDDSLTEDDKQRLEQEKHHLDDYVYIQDRGTTLGDAVDTVLTLRVKPLTIGLIEKVDGGYRVMAEGESEEGVRQQVLFWVRGGFSSYTDKDGSYLAEELTDRFGEGSVITVTALFKAPGSELSAGKIKSMVEEIDDAEVMFDAGKRQVVRDFYGGFGDAEISPEEVYRLFDGSEVELDPNLFLVNRVDLYE
jgi:hypothetical protein